MSKKIFIRHIKFLDEFESIRESWNTLFSQRDTKTIFLTWEWLFAWWKTHLDGKDLWLITVWRDNLLVGIAPLMLVNERKYGLRFRLLQSLGTPNADESDFLCENNDPEVLHAVFEYILQNSRQWDALLFHEQLSTTASISFIKQAVESNRLRVRLKTNIHYHVPITGSWDTYYKSLSKNMRQNIDRRLRRTREEYEISFEFHRGPNVQWKHFETIFEINKNGAFPDKYVSESERAFHRELLNLMTPQNLIEVAFLTLDGKPVAFEYGFNTNGRFEDWRTGYDQNFNKQSVGKALLYFLFQELFKQGYSDFDFLRGEYSHKQDWQPEEREFTTILAVRRFHIHANIALIAIPQAWQWVKVNILKNNHPEKSTKK